MKVAFKPTRVATGSHDEDGLLIFADDRLAAVLVRLDDDCHDDEIRGHWFAEAAFGPLESGAGTCFDSIDDVRRWVLNRLAASTFGGPRVVRLDTAPRQVA